MQWRLQVNVCPAIGGPGIAPPLGGRLPWGEQSTDQICSLPEPLPLGRSCRGGEFGLDLREHLRQRDGEREQRSFKIGEVITKGPVIGFLGRASGGLGAGS